MSELRRRSANVWQRTTTRGRPASLATLEWLIGIIAFSTAFRLAASTQLEGDKTVYHFSVAAIMKDEAANVREWVNHYIREGADHIYLIDNNSTDSGSLHISDFVEKGLVTMIWDPTRHFQNGLYERHIRPLFPLTTWLAFLDLDEFMYGREESTADYLRRVPHDIARLEVPWKMFGSCGFIKQPKSGIVENFVYRMGWSSNYHQYVKSIFRTAAAGMIHMHQTRITDGSKVASPLLQIEDGNTEENMSRSGDDFALHLNHYPIQSHEWFMQVKAKRGDVAHQHADNVRDEKYFVQYNKEVSVFDDELRCKYRANKACSRTSMRQPSSLQKVGDSRE